MLDKIRKKFKSHDKLFVHKKIDYFQAAIIILLLFSAILRFYNFPHVWGIGNDDSRDVAIAREAIARKALPPTGPFSSAGAFVVGPTFYWIYILSYIVIPFTITSPWIINTLLGIGLVGIMIYDGYLIGGKRLGIILGILTAFSPQLVFHSTVITNTSFLLFFAGLLLLFYLLFFKEKKYIFALLSGIFCGLCVSVHYSGLNLVIFLPLIFFVPQISYKKRILSSFIFVIGAVIANFPIIIWDSGQNFANTRNVIQYFLIDQYRFYVPNSWKLFTFKYFPSMWTFVVGYKFYIGFFTMIISGLIAGILFFKKKLSKEMIYLGVAFIILAIINRYYHGERSESYLTYFSSFVILFSGFAIEKIYSFKKIIAIVFLAVIILGNFTYFEVYFQRDNGVQLYRNFVTQLIKKYPDTNITVYDYQSKSTLYSQPLALFIAERNPHFTKNLNVGVSCIEKCKQKLPFIGNIIGGEVYNLSSVPNLKRNNNWTNVSQAGMYDSLVGFANGHKLTSTFSLSEYIRHLFSKQI